MQCPIYNCCFLLLSPKMALLGIAGLAFLLGVFSAFWPARSIALYQWIMARFNWKVEPIDAPRELRNTRLLGTCLIFLGLVLGGLVLAKFCS